MPSSYASNSREICIARRESVVLMQRLSFSRLFSINCKGASGWAKCIKITVKRLGGLRCGTEKLVWGAVGGALLFYGIQQRAKGRRDNDNLATDIAKNEGFLGIGIGVLLLLAALLS